MKFSFFVFVLVLFFCSSLWSKEVLIWTSNESAARAINELKTEFEKEYNSKVTVEVLNKDLTSLFKTASLTGKGPDILLWANDVSGELAQSGLIEPLDETPDLKKNFLPVSLRAFRFNGRLYGYPYAVESLVLLYNKNLVPSPPKSFEELVAVAHKINDPGKERYGFLYDIKTFFFSFPLLNAGDGYIFGERKDGLDPKDIGITRQGFVDGLGFLRQLTKSGLVPGSTDRGISFEKFKANKLAFTIDGPWAIKELKESRVNYALAVLPDLQNKPTRPFVGVHGFMIRRSSKVKLLAKELVENYLISSKGLSTLYHYDHRLPARRDVLKSLSSNDPELLVLQKSAERGVAMPNVPLMSAVWGAMGKALSLTLDQGMDPKRALELAVGQIK